MKYIFNILLLIACVAAENNYPIILIHGFLGWGRDEMPGYYYWGGRTDLETLLRNSGHEVYSVSVGPISSNYDRAIEAFYQIKGGQLDYGKHRSDSLNIIQQPENKYYAGLYPKWDKENPIHIIGHSQGGQTARQLEMLLKDAYQSEESLLLSNKLNGWIKSVTTISTPHNGSTLVPIMLNIFPFLLDMAPWVAGIDINSFKEIYNFDLEHWGFKRSNDESWSNYFSRMREHPAWGTKNIVAWDASVEGARQMNTFCIANPDIYYFSFVTSSTVLDSSSGRHIPDKNMTFIIRAHSRLIGMKKAFYNAN
mgnify:CR=1 FL=1